MAVVAVVVVVVVVVMVVVVVVVVVMVVAAAGVVVVGPLVLVLLLLLSTCGGCWCGDRVRVVETFYGFRGWGVAACRLRITYSSAYPSVNVRSVYTPCTITVNTYYLWWR